MELSIFAGTASLRLSQAIAHKMGVALGKREILRFPDGELHIELHETVRGRDVYLVQSLSPSADQNLIELLLLADACRRAGAARSTALIPYFGYARQDRRAHGREPVAARLIADLLEAGGLERVIAVDLHSPALEGFFSIPLEHLSALPLLVEAVRPWIGDKSVVVGPDLGAAKLADRYARALGLPVAVVHKTRTSGSDVVVDAITGDVHGRAPIIVDDMISTGGTIEAAVKALVDAGSTPDIIVVATHGLFVGPAVARLGAVPVQRFFTTDSVARESQLPLPLDLISIDALLADTISCLHEGRSLEPKIMHR